MQSDRFFATQFFKNKVPQINFREIFGLKRQKKLVNATSIQM